MSDLKNVISFKPFGEGFLIFAYGPGKQVTHLQLVNTRPEAIQAVLTEAERQGKDALIPHS